MTLWDAPPVDGLWFMQPERMSLYGTRLWERLTEEQGSSSPSTRGVRPASAGARWSTFTEKRRPSFRGS